MRHIGLFEGIGGLSLAAEWMGWETIAWCEINEFCQKILKYHFPNAKGHGDIKTTDFTIYRGLCDILTGGFPCQPWSTAGKRKGKEDERHLWPEMLRAIREVQPRWVVGENVSGLLNWGRGMVLDEIKADLEATGFEVFPPLVLPACGKNAPHRRDRIWIIAHASGFQWNKEREEGQQCREGRQTRSYINGNGTQGIITDTELRGCKERRRLPVSRIGYNSFQSGRLQTEPLLYRGDDGLSNWVDRIKALGNAVVPQVVYEIFKAIEKTDGNN